MAEGVFYFIPASLVSVPEINRRPTNFWMAQNYPNPFNPETEIRFQLPEAGQVVVKIFNTVGEEIRTLVDAEYEAGLSSRSLGWKGQE